MLRAFLFVALWALSSALSGCAEQAAPRTSTQALTDSLPELAARHHRREALTPGDDGAVRTSGHAALATEPSRVLTATFPGTLAGAFSFSDSSGPAELSLTLDGARASEIRLGEREAIWRGAFTATDVRAFADDSAAELDYLLEGPAAPRSFRWKLRLPEGAEWVTEPGGRLLLVVRGTPALAIPRPRAVDATGRELAVRMARSEGALDFTLVDEPAAWPVLLDPVVEVPLWLKRAEAAPAARRDLLMVHDAQRAVTVIFGGLNEAGFVLNDTWEWDGTRWTERSPATVPAARMSMAATWDPVRREVLMRGGHVFNGPRFADTWTWNGVDWVRKLAANDPPAYYGSRMAFDTTRGVAVLIGSESGLTDTFTWNGARWSQAAVTTRPPTLEFAGIGYDPRRGRTVVSGAYSGGINATDALWEFDGAQWNSPSISPRPSPRQNLPLVFDPSLGELLVLSGTEGGNPMPDCWKYDGARFAPLPPLPVGLGDHGAVLHGNDLLVFGGFSNPGGVRNQLWRRNTDGGWALVPAPGSPGPRTSAAMEYEPVRQLTLLTGGVTGTGSLLGDTWAWDGGSWGLVSASSPSPRALHAMAWDPRAGQLVLYGSASDPNLLGFTGAGWASVGPGPKGALTEVSLDADPARGLLQLNGTDLGGNRDHRLHVRQPDGGWEPEPTTPLTPNNIIGTVVTVFDESRGELVVIGENLSSPFEFNWADGGWRQGPVAATGLTRGGDMVYDSDRGLVVAIAPAQSGPTWERRDGGWRAVALATVPPADVAPRLAYDSHRKRVVLQTAAGATWEYSALRTQGSDCSDARHCVTGSCVDGVCCDSPCGGSLSDCQACSVAAGAAADGVCGPLVSGPPVTCAAAQPPRCLLAATCSSSSTTCPAPIVDQGCADAGSPDAGLDGGSVDAGSVDAGSVDAGSVDAGSADAGSIDAGSVDAGPSDAGSLDGGAEEFEVRQLSVSCGCSQAEGAMLLGFVLVLRRRPGRSAAWLSRGA